MCPASAHTHTYSNTRAKGYSHASSNRQAFANADSSPYAFAIFAALTTIWSLVVDIWIMRKAW